MKTASRFVVLAVLWISFFAVTPGAVSAQEASTTPDTASSTATTTPSAPAETARIGIREGSTLVGPFTIDLPAADAAASLTVSGDTATHDIPARSVLALLSALDAAHDDFSLSDLQFNTGFNAFYLRCVAVPAAAPDPSCDNWTYSVNGAFPQTGMDHYALKDGDTAYLFFGPSHRVTLATTSAQALTPVAATAETYDPAAGTFSALTGVTLGATQPDPANPWSPKEIATTTVDGSGQGVFRLSAPGTYDIGIKEDFYYPTTALVVTAAPETATTSVQTATTTIPITLEIDTATTTVFSGTVNVPSCTTHNNATSTFNGFCAFDAAGLSVDAQWFSFGAMINAIAGYAGDASTYWLWFLNGDAASVGIDSYMLQPGDTIVWTLGREPLKVSVASSSPQVGATTTVTVLGFDMNAYAFTPIAGALVSAGGATTTTDAAGHADILATSTDPLSLTVTASGFLPGSAITITPWGPATAAPTTPTPSSGSGGGGGGSSITHHSFDIPHALGFLSGIQQADGSFGTSLYSDWVALAFAAADPGAAKQKLHDYLRTASPALSSVTDYERHAMALEALGVDPYVGTSVNTIAPIVGAFDGTQIGSRNLSNDDIFGIFALLHAGYTTSDPIIQKAAAFVISAQKPDGSWDSSADMTAAALQALALVPTTPGTDTASSRGLNYLRASQQPDGGWNSIESTSWVKTALNALGTSDSAWTSSAGSYPSDALAAGQQTDGGVRPTTDDALMRAWSTSYAVVAASGKGWHALLQSFPKPATHDGTGGAVLGGATSTPKIATTTSATSTTPVIPAATTTTPLIPVITPPATTTAVMSTIPAATTTQRTVRRPAHPAPIPTTTASSAAPSSHAQAAAAAGALPQGFFGRLWALFVGLFW